MLKGFAYFSAGIYKHETLGFQSWLNVEEMNESKLIGTLKSHGWLDRHKEEYEKFIETAEVGDLLVLKDKNGEPMVAITRLRPQPDWFDD